MAQTQSTPFLIKTIGQGLNVLALVSTSKAAKLAIDVFSKPRKGKLVSDNLSFLSQSEMIQLEYNGLKIKTYYWPGVKGCVLLAHGWESNSSRWEKAVQSFQEKGLGVVAVDAPAHGGSGSDYFNAILFSKFIHVSILHYKPEALIGHSVGGMSCAFANRDYQYPFLKKIVLLGAPNEFKDILSRYSSMLGYSDRLIIGIDNEIYRRFGSWPDSYATANFVKETDIPILIVHDKEDKIIPYSDAIAIASHCKNGTLKSTEGYGHGLRSSQLLSDIVSYICK